MSTSRECCACLGMLSPSKAGGGLMPNKGAMLLGGGWRSACHSRPGSVRPYNVAPVIRIWLSFKVNGSHLRSKDQSAGNGPLVTKELSVRGSRKPWRHRKLYLYDTSSTCACRTTAVRALRVAALAELGLGGWCARSTNRSRLRSWPLTTRCTTTMHPADRVTGGAGRRLAASAATGWKALSWGRIFAVLVGERRTPCIPQGPARQGVTTSSHALPHEDLPVARRS